MKEPKKLLAINPMQVQYVYLAEIATNPIRYVRVRKMLPLDLAETLHTWADKDETTFVMIRPADQPYMYYEKRGYDQPLSIARYAEQMIARYRQAWHRPFASPRLDSICYALFERRWPIDDGAMLHRIRKEFQIPIGSGAYCPPDAVLALAAALVTARATKGTEYRLHSERA